MVGEEIFSYNPVNELTSLLGISTTTAIILLAFVSVWSLAWKGIALWKSARKTHKIWFIVLLIINSIGILEILYIYVFSEIKFNSKSEKKDKKKR